jgi:hypothetical protein
MSDRYYYERVQVLEAERTKMLQALRDIAGSECTPTGDKAWEFCRDVAKAALEPA